MLIEELFIECDDIVQQIISHNIVKTLAGYGDLSREQLITASENFYIQDYYFLTYGYNLARSYRIDTTSDQELLKRLGDHRNPFTSSSMKSLLQIIKNRNLSVERGANATTQAYIIFDIEKSFSSVTELFISRLACSAVFNAIGVTVSRSPYINDEILGEWVNIYTNAVQTDYLSTQISICSELIADISEEKQEIMISTFKQGCQHELSFLQSLL